MSGIKTNTELDSILKTNGFELGKIYHIFGTSNSGKSLFVLEAIKAFYENGYASYLIDTQGSYTDYYHDYSRDYSFLYSNIVHREKVLETALDVLDYEEIHLLAIDSIEIFDNKVQCSDFLRRLYIKALSNNKTIIFTNQIRKAVYKRNDLGVNPRYKSSALQYSNYSIYIEKLSRLKLRDYTGLKVNVSLGNNKVTMNLKSKIK